MDLNPMRYKNGDWIAFDWNCIIKNKSKVRKEKWEIGFYRYL